MKKIYLALIILLITATNCFSSDNAGAFIENTIGARPAGMGSAFCAITGDTNSIYWNPAGLAAVQNQEIGFSSYNAYETRFLCLEGIMPLKDFIFGIGFIGAGTDGAKYMAYNNTTGRWDETGSTFGYNGSAIFLSLAKKLTQDFYLGVNTKIIKEDMAANKAYGFGADLGMLYQIENISLGLNFQNIISPQMQWNTASKNVDSIPANIKTGLGIKLFDEKLLIATDLNLTKNRPVGISAGCEFKPINAIAFRLGIQTDTHKLENIFKQLSRIEGLSLGLGLNLNPFTFDLSYNTADINEIDASYRISIGYIL
ncbi:PorV/PorQ family protein [Candidatus Margulisiibacteriota bacterium]